MNNYIYIHVCCINNYEKIFNKLLHKIKDSGLYDEINEIRCCVLGEYNVKLFNDPKIIIRNKTENIKLYEVFTINTLYEDAQKEDFNVLYLHTKGVSKPGNKNISSWTSYMCYFNIYKYKECLEILKNNDTVGVNLQDLPGQKCHYSGNFWWSKTDYIRKLSKCIYYNYNAPEFWITENKIGNYVSLWHSKWKHYKKIYPKKKYVGKKIKPFKLFDYKK